MDIVNTVQNNSFLQIILVVVAVYFFTHYNTELLDNTAKETSSASTLVPVQLAQPGTLASSAAAPAAMLTAEQKQIDTIVAGKTQLSTNDLLPVYDEASDFAKQNPVSKILQENNLLQSGYHIGINSTIQSNKIQNYDLRSMPPIPKQELGPWNQSSYEESPGLKRREFNLGF